jgi:hypothetical protein
VWNAGSSVVVGGVSSRSRALSSWREAGRSREGNNNEDDNGSNSSSSSSKKRDKGGREVERE